MPHVPDWMPEEELRLLQSQPKASPSVADNEKIAMAIFRDNVALAAEIIGELAVNGEKESTRLNASKYIVERVMGRLPDASASTGKDDMFTDLFSSVAREPTAEERANGTRVSRI